MTAIDVTQEDIDRGVRGQFDACALARATSRATGVHAMVALVWVDIEDKRYALPKKAIKFRQNFDAGKPVKPIRFELPI